MAIPLRLGTRGSLLARTQSQLVAAAIEKANPSVAVELVILKTTGDQVQDRPLADIGGKGLFTKELEQALLRNEIDLAAHSYKDVPVTMPLVDQSELAIACVPHREDARDVLVVRDGEANVRSLPAGAKVGTGSLRRQCQLLDLRSDLQILPIRGNIDTRLRKLREGEYDAIVLAMAGLKRTGLFDSTTMSPLPIEELTPSAGQGALALQIRLSDEQTRSILAPLHQLEAAECVKIERHVVEYLNGDCHSPIGAHAVFDQAGITLSVAIGEAGGKLPVRRAKRVFMLSDAISETKLLAQTIITQ